VATALLCHNSGRGGLNQREPLDGSWRVGQFKTAFLRINHYDHYDQLMTWVWDLSETHVISCMLTTSSAFVDAIPSWLLTKVLGLCCFVNRTIWSTCDCQMMVPCQVTRLPSCPAWCRNIYLSYRSFSNLPLDSWTVRAWGKCRHFRPSLETFVPPISGCHTSQVSLLSGRLRP